MKTFLFALVVMLAAVAFSAPTALAGTNGQVCPVQGSDEGATVVDNGDGTATITVEEGFTVTYLCLKAGSEEQGCGFAEYAPDLAGPGSAEFAIPCEKELSHFGIVAEPTGG